MRYIKYLYLLYHFMIGLFSGEILGKEATGKT